MPVTLSKGFNLIELLIALVIVGILTTLALPAYQNYLYKVRRADGQAALLHLASKIEHYYSLNHSYAGISLQKLGVPDKSPEEFYQLEIAENTPSTFLIKAKPISSQTGDIVCQTLTYNQLGQKGVTGTGTVKECW